jgi:hypothetical protein
LSFWFKNGKERVDQVPGVPDLLISRRKEDHQETCTRKSRLRDRSVRETEHRRQRRLLLLRMDEPELFKE